MQIRTADEFFSNRIVNMWNSLPDYVIMSDTINTFKNGLDAHWYGMV